MQLAPFLAALAFLVALTPAMAAPIDPGDIRVLDGDTIRTHGAKPDVRLIPFNAPEKRRAKCEPERVLGDKATHRLREIVKAGKLDLELVACSCPAGTEGTFPCNYGRKCGILRSDGQNVGDILIKEDLAVPFQCGETSCPPTPRPWCKNPAIGSPAAPRVDGQSASEACSAQADEKGIHGPERKRFRAACIRAAR